MSYTTTPGSPRRSDALGIRVLSTLAVTCLVAGCMVEEEADPPPLATAEPSAPEETPEPVEDVLDSQGVSAAHPAATAVGEEVLSEGGNAVDAAIATAFAVSVVEPFASGIGGGGAAIIAGPEGEPVYYDYRETVAQDGDIPETGTGTPGFVAGMAQLHEEYGSLEWEELLAPAEELAADGFAVSEFLALRMRTDFGPGAIEDLDHFSPDGDPLDAGDELVQQDLATTLQTLAAEGPEAFYTGSIAEELAEEDGLEAESLEAYEVMVAEPVAGSFGDYEIVSAAPALPGAAIIQMLQVAEANGAGQAEPGSADYIEALSAGWLTGEETAMTQLGDPYFIDIPLEEITDPELNSQIEADAQFGTEASAPLNTGTKPEAGSDPNTTHITVVDSDGVMVSMTNTITNFWGSGEMVGGFFLNNQLSRFEAIDSPANTPEPGRRSVSWAAPTVVLDAEGRPVLGIGTPGGPQIPNILGSVLTGWALHSQPLADAVAAPRFHFDGEEELLLIEEEPPSADAEALEDLGWEIEISPREEAVFGSIQALEVDYETGEVTGVDDERREGSHAILE